MSPAVRPGAPFGELPVPESVEIVDIPVSVGVLTAMRTIVPADAANAQQDAALFIPGLTGSKEDFYLLFPYLARLGWQVWAYSQRGQADSAGPEDPAWYTRSAGAADAIEVARVVMQETGQARIHLLGHSYGGLIAQAAAIMASQHDAPGPTGRNPFSSLVLMCSGPHGWPGRHADMMAQIMGDPQDLWSAGHPTITAQDANRLSAQDQFARRRAIATRKAQLIGALQQLASVYDASFDLRDTGVPVMVCHGQNDYAWPQEWQRREARILDARYEVIADAGHLPNMENPEATAALLDEFWKTSRARRIAMGR